MILHHMKMVINGIMCVYDTEERDFVPECVNYKKGDVVNYNGKKSLLLVML